MQLVWIAALLLLAGCTALADADRRTQRLIVSADQLESLRTQLEAQPCAADERVTVLGVEDRTGRLHLLIGCLGQ